MLKAESNDSLRRIKSYSRRRKSRVSAPSGESHKVTLFGIIYRLRKVKLFWFWYISATNLNKNICHELIRFNYKKKYESVSFIKISFREKYSQPTRKTQTWIILRNTRELNKRQVWCNGVTRYCLRKNVFPFDTAVFHLNWNSGYVKKGQTKF